MKVISVQVNMAGDPIENELDATTHSKLALQSNATLNRDRPRSRALNNGPPQFFQALNIFNLKFGLLKKLKLQFKWLNRKIHF
jgi:hypothetical protein